MIFSHVWKLIARITLVIGVLLTLFVTVELFRAFVTFYRLRPYLGWTFLAVLAVILLVAFLYIWRQLHRYPKPLIPPALPPFNVATHAELKRYTRYLMRYLERLAANRRLDEATVAMLNDELETITSLMGHHPLNEDFIRFITKADQEIIPPVLALLKQDAEKEIRRSVRDVMLGVTLSPYHSIDLLIVLYRNGAMVFRVMDIFETTPSPRAQFRILRDVLRVVATVNFLYVGRNLIENLFAFVPWVGRVADDIGQGLGAGLFTSAAGHAAIDRCASYHEWEKAAAVESLTAQSREFIRDVKNIFTKDVLPDIKNRIMKEVPPDQTAQPGFWDNLQSGVNKAFDTTLRTMGDLIPFKAAPVDPSAPPPTRRPTVASPARPTYEAYDPPPPREERRRRVKRRHGVSRVLHTFGQRVKYTFGLGRRD